MCVRVCVWVCGCDFIGLYFIFKREEKRYMIFHLFNSYQKEFTNQYCGEGYCEYLNALNHRGMLGWKNKTKNDILL